MNWNSFGLSAVCALIALATIACGEPQTVRNSANGVSTAAAPAGTQARLRLETVDTSVSCDERTHAVRVWLDDLPSEPVRRPTAEPVYSGLFTPEPAPTGPDPES